MLSWCEPIDNVHSSATFLESDTGSPEEVGSREQESHIGGLQAAMEISSA